MSELPALTDEELEAILESRPGFVHDYFLRKATASHIEAWMSKKRKKQKLSIQEFNRVPRLSQGSSTNVVLKPLANSLAGSSTKLKQLYGTEDLDDTSVKQDDAKENNVPPKKDYTLLSETELFMELIRDISNELDINTLSHKILLNIGILTKADRCSLFLVKGTYSPEKDKRFLVSRLFDVTAESTVEDALKPEGKEIVIPIGVGIAGQSALTGEIINLPDVYKDPRFNVEIDKNTGYRTCSMLCMPIKSHDGQVVGVAQVINKKDGEMCFTSKDEKTAKNYLTFCGIGLTNAQLFEVSVQEFKRNQVLLSLAKNIFEQTDSVDSVVRRIMAQAQELFKCERCTVYIIDLEMDHHVEEVFFSKVFDLMTGDEENKQIQQKGVDESSNILSGLASLVARSGETMNISDGNNNSCSLKTSDNDKGSCGKAHFILCVPIRNHEGKIIGVGQLVNKINGHPFTENDENMFEAFGIFCGLGIHNAQLYEKACIMLAKQMVAMEVLSYHASASPEEASKLNRMEIKSSEEYNLHSFAFDDIEMSDIETCAACLRMFYDLEVPDVFHIPSRVMARFVLTVKKNYRPVTYHNWRHAFNVAQTMFAILTTGQMHSWFSELEAFVLLVGCLCHDLDHRGTNNTFQVKADSPIAKLYTTSTMEHHHFDHSIMILNSEGNNIFAGLNSDQYRRAIKTLEHSILSTDLALYFKKRGVFQQLVDAQNTDWAKEDHKIALRAMLMTACDVAAITKPWSIQQRVAELVASEFFEQGDLERQQLQAEPIPMMDRHKKHELPKMQVGFIDFVCLPVYEMIFKVNTNLKPMYDGVKANRKKWSDLAEENDVLESTQGGRTKPYKETQI